MKVLFVCTGNTCRSVLAEYIAKTRFPEHVFESAGFSPQPAKDAENAIYTLRRLDIDASNHKPTHVENHDLNSYNVIVAIDRHIADRLSGLETDNERLVTWNVSDPWGHNLVEYQQCARDIMRALSQLKLR